MKNEILLIEDNDKVQNFNSKMLEDEGYNVKVAMTLSKANEIIKKRLPDVIVLDIGMPDGSGLDFLKQLRRTSAVPVLMLTGFNQSEDVVACFKAGCDDYLSKPYSFDVLLVRLQNILKKAEHANNHLKKCEITLNTLTGKAYVNDKDLLLTPKNFALLQLFVQHIDIELTQDDIYKGIWDDTIVQSSRIVINEISRLRKKLVGSGYTISSVYGGKYILEKE